MNHDLITDYFQKSGFTDMQAEAASRILAELVTREDLAQLKAELTWRIIAATTFLATLMALLNAFVG